VLRAGIRHHGPDPQGHHRHRPCPGRHPDLFFLSGNFFSLEDAPAGLRVVANIFPVRRFYQAMVTAFNPHVTGSGLALGHLGILALWGAAGLALEAWKFRWTPSGDE
jgi:ABC-2 type transport system permease protein